MIAQEELEKMRAYLTDIILNERKKDGIWRGRLSSSAISTAVAAYALSLSDNAKYQHAVSKAIEWLMITRREDGSWGDSPESPSNMTATLLSYSALYALGKPPENTKRFLEQKFGNELTEDCIVRGVLNYYGKDLTFSVPILIMCAMAGLVNDWRKIPFFPFELALLPQSFFRFLRLPVVSYAIPAFIAVGILTHRKREKNFLCKFRNTLINKVLKRLLKLQPSDGGFLEAAPLTAFVTICLCGAGFTNHQATKNAVDFLADTQRNDGSWPIDTDLSGWVTSLSIKALGYDNIPDKEFLSKVLKNNAFKERHPFTGAQAGGWGWSDLSGSVPDADDTSAALIALHILQKGKCCNEAENGVRWLLDLQNSDGGMPTFCKGWSKLPFDSSSPDISAHSLLAFELWRETLDASFRVRCSKSIERLLIWLQKNQADDGSWTPLWFGEQESYNERSPVYGTAVTVEHLCTSHHPLAAALAIKGADYLCRSQNDDGGWGGQATVTSKVITTSRALSALASMPKNYENAITSGIDYLYRRFLQNDYNKPEPIGLYFARLWYSEKMYNPVFMLDAVTKTLCRVKKGFLL
ncbi:MAG: squalene--hopene cyclase [Prevotellaceae bacterium]|jgi:squalene-hopene/tetraprenyl-beta-curcumene cyclase|nr:squalene--hopene cyclase [Prevotellaceae bacterium]